MLLLDVIFFFNIFFPQKNEFILVFSFCFKTVNKRGKRSLILRITIVHCFESRETLELSTLLSVDWNVTIS